MPDTKFCYTCRRHHAIEEMRQITTKDGTRWRCIKSIEAAKVGVAARDAFGRQVTAINKSEAKSMKDRSANPEWKQDK